VETVPERVKQTDAPEMRTKEVSAEWSSLLDALEVFDATIAPVGLYAAEEYQMQDKPQPRLKVEWEQCLKPVMKAMGCNPLGRVLFERNQASIHFRPNGEVSCLEMIRLSKIKVRRYGNAYRVDPHLDFSSRWKEANLAGSLNQLAKYYSRPGGLLLFIGFDSDPKPFSVELDDLQSGAAFSKRFEKAMVRTWDDPHGRGFKVIAALWHVTESKNLK
jgi:hypothetical protein